MNGTENDSLSDLLEKGLQLYGMGEPLTALQLWRDVLRIEPENIRAKEYIRFVREGLGPEDKQAYEASLEAVAPAPILTPLAKLDARPVSLQPDKITVPTPQEQSEPEKAATQGSGERHSSGAGQNGTSSETPAVIATPNDAVVTRASSEEDYGFDVDYDAQEPSSTQAVLDGTAKVDVGARRLAERSVDDNKANPRIENSQVKGMLAVAWGDLVAPGSEASADTQKIDLAVKLADESENVASGQNPETSGDTQNDGEKHESAASSDDIDLSGIDNDFESPQRRDALEQLTTPVDTNIPDAAPSAREQTDRWSSLPEHVISDSSDDVLDYDKTIRLKTQDVQSFLRASDQDADANTRLDSMPVDDDHDLDDIPISIATPVSALSGGWSVHEPGTSTKRAENHSGSMDWGQAFSSPTSPPEAQNAWDLEDQVNPVIDISSGKNGEEDFLEPVTGETRYQGATEAEPADAEPVVDTSSAKEMATPNQHRPITEECESLMQGARDLFELGDFSGSMELVEKVLSLDADNVEGQDYLERNQDTLLKMYESKIGSFRKVPHVTVGPDEIIWLNLHHRAGFLLAQIDGAISFEDLLELSAMSKLETCKILVELINEGVIVADL